LLNLGGNAIKFTNHGEVRIGIFRKPGGVRFEINDSGIGIPELAQKKLFSNFSQVDASTTRKFGGTGLGLAISKRMVEGMGGNIGVNSTEGKGSCFWFELPLDLAKDQNAAIIQTNSTYAPAQPLQPEAANVASQEILLNVPSREPEIKSTDTNTSSRILLVEDNKINQKLALVLLRKLGYSVDLAENGVEAVDAVWKNNYDLILMDMQMPVMGGIEATQKIRSLGGAKAGIPIVALTANAMESDFEACISAGMNEMLTKPINREKLISCLEHWVKPKPTDSSN